MQGLIVDRHNARKTNEMHACYVNTRTEIWFWKGQKSVENNDPPTRGATLLSKFAPLLKYCNENHTIDSLLLFMCSRFWMYYWLESLLAGTRLKTCYSTLSQVINIFQSMNIANLKNAHKQSNCNCSA